MSTLFRRSAPAEIHQGNDTGAERPETDAEQTRLVQPAITDDVLALAALLLLVLVFFWDVLVGPRVLLPADVLYRIPPWSGLPEAARYAVPHNGLIADAVLQNVAWKSFARDAFAGGELPLWNPYEYAGLPFLAGGQSGSLYPLGALFYLLPVERAYGPFLALHVFMAGAFAYAFARVLGCRPAAALVGGVGFAFSAFLIVSFTWPMIVSAAAWLPLLLLVVELIVRGWERGAPPERSVALAVLGALALALQILAGHLEITFYAAFTLLFYGTGRLVLGPLRARRPGAALGGLACLGLMGLLGPLVAAVQLLPFYELIGQNFRRGLVDYATVIGYALPRAQLATFLVPDFFGNPSHHDYLSLLSRAWRPAPEATEPPHTIWWGAPKNYVEAASYVGVLPLLLAPLGALLARTRQAFLLALLGLLSLSLAFGSPLYGLLFFGVPGIDQLHTPFRWIYPYTIAVCALAALGVESVLRRGRGWLAGLGLLVGGLGGLGLAGLAIVALRPSRFAALADSALAGSSRLRRAFADGDMLLSYQWRNALLLALALFLAGAALWLLVRRPRLGAGLAVAALALDLFLVHYDFNTRADPAPIRAALPAVDLLRQETEPFRIVGMVDGEPLAPIAGTRLGIEDVRGYDTVIPRRYVEYWSLIEPPQGLLYSKLQGLSRPESLGSPFLRLLNVRYVLSARPLDSPELEPAQAGAMHVYRLRDPMPRAFLVGLARHAGNDDEALALLRAPGFDPRREVVLTGAPPSPESEGAVAGSVTWLERRSDRLRLDVEADRPAYLVVADFHFPGWLASVDGADVPILLANHAFRAVAVPAGRHAVELRYRPDSVRLGGALSGLAGLGSLLALAVCGWRLTSGWLARGAAGDGPLRRVARNALSGIGAQLVGRAIDFAFAMVMLRYLAAEGVGRYAWAIAIAGYLEIVSNFGLNALVIREGSAAPERLGRLGGSSLLVRLAIWATGLPLVVLVILGWRGALGLADESAVAALLLCLALLPGNVAATYSALFYARERVEVPAALTVVTTLLKVSLGLVALLSGYGIVGLAAVALVGNVLTALALWILAGRLGIAPRLEVDRGEARSMLGPALPLMLNHLLATLFFRIDVLLLQALRGEVELGYYATAYKFVDGLGIIPSAFTFAVFPLLSRLAAAQPDAMRRAYAMSLKLLVSLSVPLALLVTALAYPLVLLLGGRAYLPDAAIALQLLIWFLPLSFANGLTQYAIVAAGHQRAIVGAFALAVAFNVAANLLALPAYGYRGAAVVTVLSELALALPFGVVVARQVGLDIWRTLWPFLAGAVAALCVYLVLEPPLGGGLALALGLGAYAVVLAGLRPLDSYERSQLRALFERLRIALRS
ncbi:MAG TPA: oligosaccharide flippase family protein [Chloroflexota bacterium]